MKKLKSIVILILLVVLLAIILKPKKPYEFNISSTRYVESENPITAFELRPYYEGRSNSIRTNKQGIADYEYDLEKDSNTTRIIVLGDSVTEGFGVAFNETYPKLLENHLSEQSNKFEVINFGTYMYSTIQELELLNDKGLKYDPDYVIIGYVLNDPLTFGFVFEELNKINDYRHEEAILKESNAPLSCKARLRIKKMISKTRLIKVFKSKAESNLEFYNKIHQNTCTWNTVQYSFEKIRELSDKNDFKVILVIFPLIVDYEEYEFTDIHKKVRLEGEKNGFVVIDLLEDFRESRQSLTLDSEDHVHPNKYGHEIVTKKIFEWLENNKIN